MSRSGYSDDLDNWDLIKWRGQVASALRGKRGQAFLRDLVAALDAMPVKELIMGDLENLNGVCAIGAVGRARGIDMSELYVHDRESIGHVFNIAGPMAAEIAYLNDEAWPTYLQTPAERWESMREWAVSKIK